MIALIYFEKEYIMKNSSTKFVEITYMSEKLLKLIMFFNIKKVNIQKN